MENLMSLDLSKYSLETPKESRDYCIDAISKLQKNTGLTIKSKWKDMGKQAISKHIADKLEQKSCHLPMADTTSQANKPENSPKINAIAHRPQAQSTVPEQPGKSQKNPSPNLGTAKEDLKTSQNSHTQSASGSKPNTNNPPSSSAPKSNTGKASGSHPLSQSTVSEQDGETPKYPPLNQGTAKEDLRTPQNSNTQSASGSKPNTSNPPPSSDPKLKIEGTRMLKDLEAIREDPYKVLGGSRTDSDSEIRKKFINLAKKCHTDKKKKMEILMLRKYTKRIMQILNGAYDTLKDPVERAKYDRTSEQQPPQDLTPEATAQASAQDPLNKNIRDLPRRCISRHIDLLKTLTPDTIAQAPAQGLLVMKTRALPQQCMSRNIDLLKILTPETTAQAPAQDLIDMKIRPPLLGQFIYPPQYQPYPNPKYSEQY